VSTGIGIVLLLSSAPSFIAQQQQGFALERFYPSAPGAGWSIMEDLSHSYPTKPLPISGLQ
jgi:hypothetical protein